MYFVDIGRQSNELHILFYCSVCDYRAVSNNEVFYICSIFSCVTFGVRQKILLSSHCDYGCVYGSGHRVEGHNAYVFLA